MVAAALLNEEKADVNHDGHLSLDEIANAVEQGMGKHSGHSWIEDPSKRDAYLRSEKYKDRSKILAFCRLWCIVEIYAGLEYEKPVVFRCIEATTRNPGEKVAALIHEGAKEMLEEFSHLVYVEHADCANPEDRRRELEDHIGVHNWARLNTSVRAALVAGADAAGRKVWEVDAYACGEPAAIRTLSGKKITHSLIVAAAGGHIQLVCYLAAKMGISDFTSLDYRPLWHASRNGDLEMVQALLNGGADPNQNKTKGIIPLFNHSNASPLCVASQKGHTQVVESLLAKGANVNMPDDDEITPLMMAAQNGQVEVMRVLLGHGAVSDIATTREQGELGIPKGSTALSLARTLKDREARALIEELLQA